MFEKNTITRRKLFKGLFNLMLIPAGIIWFQSVKNVIEQKTKVIKISGVSKIPNGLNFFDSIIVYKDQSIKKVFSASCTHLGCTIKVITTDIIACPCHGSKFNHDGQVIEGPSNKNLIELSFSVVDDSLIVRQKSV